MGFLDNSLWFKILSNGSTEHGMDKAILEKRASWTRGAQDIVAVSYLFDNYSQGFIVIVPPDEKNNFTKIQQLDDMTILLKEGKPVRQARKFKVENNGYKFLKKYENIKIKNNLLEKDGDPVESELLCFQFLREEDKTGEDILESEDIEKSSFVTIEIDNEGKLSIYSE